MDPTLVDQICYFVDKGTQRSFLLLDISSLFPSQEDAELAIQTLLQMKILTAESDGKWIVVTAWSPNKASKIRGINPKE